MPPVLLGTWQNIMFAEFDGPAQPFAVRANLRRLVGKCLDISRSRKPNARCLALKRLYAKHRLPGRTPEGRGEFRGFTQNIMMMGGTQVDHGRVNAIKSRKEQSLVSLRRKFEEIQETGVFRQGPGSRAYRFSYTVQRTGSLSLLAFRRIGNRVLARRGRRVSAAERRSTRSSC